MFDCPLILTSLAGFPPLDSHLNSTSSPSTALASRSLSGQVEIVDCDDDGENDDVMTGGSGGTRTVTVAYRDLIGATPSAAPTWH